MEQKDTRSTLIGRPRGVTIYARRLRLRLWRGHTHTFRADVPRIIGELRQSFETMMTVPLPKRVWQRAYDCSSRCALPLPHNNFLGACSRVGCGSLPACGAAGLRPSRSAGEELQSIKWRREISRMEDPPQGQ